MCLSRTRIALYRTAAGMANLRVCGIDCHIGSQLTEIPPFVAALQKLLGLVDQLAAMDIKITHIDIGGGLGIRYRDETPPPVAEYIKALSGCLGDRKQKILFEPGRSLVGNTGILLTRVEYLKHGADRNFAVVDAAMNDLMRPALYDAWHDIQPVHPRPGPTRRYEIVGPVCETGDFLGHDRELNLAEGDLVAIMSAGAYGMSMSSNYNTRPRAPEVMVAGEKFHVVRSRETFEHLIATEKIYALIAAETVEISSFDCVSEDFFLLKFASRTKKIADARSKMKKIPAVYMQQHLR